MYVYVCASSAEKKSIVVIQTCSDSNPFTLIVSSLHHLLNFAILCKNVVLQLSYFFSLYVNCNKLLRTQQKLDYITKRVQKQRGKSTMPSF